MFYLHYIDVYVVRWQTVKQGVVNLPAENFDSRSVDISKLFIDLTSKSGGITIHQGSCSMLLWALTCVYRTVANVCQQVIILMALVGRHLIPPYSD